MHEWYWNARARTPGAPNASGLAHRDDCKHLDTTQPLVTPLAWSVVRVLIKKAPEHVCAVCRHRLSLDSLTPDYQQAGRQINPMNPRTNQLR